MQLRWPDMPGGANKVSLIEAQANYRTLGVSEPRLSKYVRTPQDDEHQDEGWRPIVAEDDFEKLQLLGKSPTPWPEDRTLLYWWRKTFWRLESQ